MGIVLVIGSIEYLNLLPFKIFLKKFYKRKGILEYKKGVPSFINKEFYLKNVILLFKKENIKYKR